VGGALSRSLRPRPLLVWLGAVVWAAALVGVTFSPSLSWMIFFRVAWHKFLETLVADLPVPVPVHPEALNGVGLGIVQPLLFSLVADKSETHGGKLRGRACKGSSPRPL